MPITIEVCVDSLSGALLAQSLGADRLELCANLSIGGTTPSVGLLRKVRAAVELPIHVLIRPRGGDFLYEPAEVETMLADIAFAKAEGADGIVCGALTPKGEIDQETTKKLFKAARPLVFTFHRAFDHCVEPMRAFTQLKEIGVDHLLTSGQSKSVSQGLSLLKQIQFLSDRMMIMPGGGVSPENLVEILNKLQPKEIHFSGSRPVASAMEYLSPVLLGAADSSETKLVTDPVRLGKMISAVRSWEETQIEG